MVDHPPICPEPFKYGRSFTGAARRLAAGYQMFMWEQRRYRWMKVFQRMQDRGSKYTTSAWFEMLECHARVREWYKWGNAS
jgi:hypothetical protein